MKESLIAASLVTVVVIALVAMASASENITGHAIGLFSDPLLGATIAVGLIVVGLAFVFLWNHN
jgi:hypothetical protein